MQEKSKALVLQKNFLEKWSNTSRELAKVKSIPDVFNSKAPALSVVNKELGTDFLIKYLAIWISKINDFSGGNMGVDQCKDSASYIYEDFYFLNLADLKLIAKRLRVRKFIRITGNEIYREVESYFNERCEHASDHSKKLSDDNKTLSIGSKVLDDKELKQYYKDIKDGKPLSKPPKDIERNSTKLDREHKKFKKKYKSDKKQ